MSETELVTRGVEALERIAAALERSNQRYETDGVVCDAVAVYRDQPTVPAAQPAATKPKADRPVKTTTPIKAEKDPTEEDMRKALNDYAIRQGASGLPNVVAAQRLYKQVTGLGGIKDCPKEKYAEVIAAAKKAT